MNKDTLLHFKQRLQNLQAELHALQAAAEDAGKPVMLDQASVGRLSRMEAMQAQQMALEAGRRRQQQQLGAASALRRIESGDYGYCLDCGEDIDPARLDFDPAVLRCVSCEDKA